MGVFRHTRTGLSALAVCVATVTATSAAIPIGLRVDGVASNDRVTSTSPEFCWDFAGSQINWQIQVDDDPAFRRGSHPSGPRVWFWDSGRQAKGKDGAARCALMREHVASGFVTRALDRRPQPIHWRVRVQTADGQWSEWATDTLRMNALPGMPEEIAVRVDRTEGQVAVPERPRAGSAATYYVSPAGDDSAEGTRSAPFQSLQRAVSALAPGDTLLVHGGIYHESVVISTLNGQRSGAPGRPIHVRAVPGETPVISAPGTGSRIAVQIGPDPRVAHWVLDGLTFGGEATLTGLQVIGARDVGVTNCRLAEGMPPAAVGIRAGGGAEDLTLAGCSFAQPVSVQVDLGATGPVTLRGNEFTRFDGDHALRIADPAAGAIAISGNTFHDGAPRAGAILLAQGAAGSHIVGNVVNRISGAGADGIVIDGSARLVIENNLLHQIEGAAIRFEAMGQQGVYRNNIFSRCGAAVSSGSGESGPKGAWMSGSVLDYNLFFENGSDVEEMAVPGPALRHAPVGNCHGCDPAFGDAGRGDFRLGSGSPAIDSADPASPVPAGGGDRADIGPFEAGAGDPPYEYRVSFAVHDATPAIAWRLNDLDNARGADRLDRQSRYQIQIDAHPTFDSRGGRPHIDSGVVRAAEEQFIVPSTHALAAGDYYVRVRQWDDREPSAGAWSDARRRFRVLSEPQPPYVASLAPADGAGGIAPDATVSVLIKDSGSGVDPTSIRLLVNGVPVIPRVRSEALDARVTWTPEAGFVPGSTVSLRIVAEDRDPASPTMDATYRFQVRADSPRQGPGNIRVSR